VDARLDRVFDEARSFEKQKVMFGPRAHSAKALDQRVLTAGYLLYEHRSRFEALAPAQKQRRVATSTKLISGLSTSLAAAILLQPIRLPD
jgi:hypothetical protein